MCIRDRQTVDPQLYEAAKVDGAKGRHLFRHITVPMLRPAILFTTVVTSIGYLQVFEEPFVMTGGGPLDSTQTIVFQAVERGYGKQDISGGSTISVILFVIVFSISLIQRYLTREKK